MKEGRERLRVLGDKKERERDGWRKRKGEKLGGGRRNWKHQFAKERFKHPS
jgi:hypothetical protein